MKEKLFELHSRSHVALIDAIQSEAAKIEDFKDGAIAVLYKALREDAFELIGATRQDEQIVRDAHIVKIPSVGKGNVIGDYAETSFVREAGWRGDKSREEVDCRGYVTQKICAAVRAFTLDYGFSASDLPEEDSVLGARRSSGGASVWVVSTYWGSSDGSKPEPVPFLLIGIGVSGATGEEDQQCVLAGGSAIEAFCQDLANRYATDVKLEGVNGEKVFEPTNERENCARGCEGD